jgi:hypothetical protein
VLIWNYRELGKAKRIVFDELTRIQKRALTERQPRRSLRCSGSPSRLPRRHPLGRDAREPWRRCSTDLCTRG